MMNNFKYRKLSLYAFVASTFALLLSLGTLWNSLFNTNAKHAGWIVFFILFLFICAAFLYVIVYRISDQTTIEKIRNEAFESGKAEVMLQIEQKKQEEEHDHHDENNDIEKRKEAVFSDLRGNLSGNSLCNKVLSNLARELEIVQGVIYLKNDTDIYNPVSEYALTDRKPSPFKAGENLNGQTVANKTTMIVYDVPEDYFKVSSGLGSAMPSFLIIVPVLFNDDCIAVMELASFRKPDAMTSKILDTVSDELGNRLNKHAVA